MKELQKKIDEFCKENKINNTPEYRILDTMSELGEVAKEIIKMTNYGREPLKFREELKSELGDLLFSLVTIANYFDVDLEEALNLVLEKYKKRLTKGSAGSEND